METPWNNTEWEIEEGDPSLLKSGTTVYLAGPMTGMENYNHTTFFSAAEFLSQEGMLVLNPATLPIGMPEKNYMPICLAMLNEAEIIAMLPGWQTSVGACLEESYAYRQGKGMIFLKKR